MFVKLLSLIQRIELYNSSKKNVGFGCIYIQLRTFKKERFYLIVKFHSISSYSNYTYNHQMHFKIVVDKQTRILDCKQPLTMEALTSYVTKLYPHLSSFSFYYIDEEGDQIILESKDDIHAYLEISSKRPKIYVKRDQSDTQLFDVSQIMNKTSEYKSETSQKVEEEKKSFGKIQEQIFEKEISKEALPVQEIRQEKRFTDVHQVTCDDCGLTPLTGIRYKCSICPSFDLCQDCHDYCQHREGKNKHKHPFIKIRDPKSAPVAVQISFKENQNERKQAKGDESRQKIMQSLKMKKEVKLRYDSRLERQLVIISLLENLFGSEYEQYYKAFARRTTEETQEKVCASFWQEMTLRKEEQEKSVTTWLKKNIQKLSDKVADIFSFYYD